ncbi:hypothetical protein [Mycolicibacterium austroafricanum]|uniref:hypothetical protein n=1 Tax=Mycolicibacterium austroafricanum TaxID=39687 RepID=UPI0005608D66|nr:hypothetical protein [Mycolicibacterium austroafricanum]QZY46349.1 hypothetical protein K5L12_00700 [Mycolicibacterium austroafricanum]
MEGDAGTSRLTFGGQERSDPGIESRADADAVSTEEPIEEEPTDTRRPSRLGKGWVASICAVLLLLGGGGITAGYLALRANARAAEVARSDDAALQAAKECVAATQAPDTAAMTAAQSKILECSTGEFGVQAGLFSSVLAEAYQAADAAVAVDDLRAAVERRNEDGTVNVLVAVRVRISNSEAADQRVGYRLRATMAFDEGQYRISSLDQVNS